MLSYFFIGYALERQVRRLKFETDGTFDTIIIEVGAQMPSVTTSSEIIKSLDIEIPFDYAFYESADDAQRCGYYIHLYREALQLASAYKSIPLKEMMSYLTSLEENGFDYSWDYRGLLLREYGLRVKFVCHLTTFDFIIKAIVFKKKTPEPICEGVVVRTLPDSLFMSDVSAKRILVRDGKIVFFSWSGTYELLYLNVKELMDGRVVNHYPSSPYPEGSMENRLFYHFQTVIKYDNYDYLSGFKTP